MTAVNALTSDPRHLTPKAKQTHKSSFFVFLSSSTCHFEEETTEKPFEWLTFPLLVVVDIF